MIIFTSHAVIRSVVRIKKLIRAAFILNSQQFVESRTLTHVLQCSNRGAELLEEEWVVGLSAAKINDLDDVHVGDDDVLWLDVQVEDAPGMEVIQTLEDLHNVGHHVILGVTEPETRQEMNSARGGIF